MDKSQRALIVVCALANTSEPKPDQLFYGSIETLASVVEGLLSSEYGIYRCLRNADATQDRLLVELANAANTKGIEAIDLIVNLHGSPGYLWFYDDSGSGTSTAGLGIEIRHLRIQDKLRMVYSTACYGATHNADFIASGFDVAVGAKGLDDNATYEFPIVLSNWRMGNTVSEAIHAADDTIVGKIATSVSDKLGGGDSEKIIDGAGSTTINSGDISPAPPPKPWVMATYSVKKQWVIPSGGFGYFVVELFAQAHNLISPKFTWEIENHQGTSQNPGCKDNSWVTTSLPVGPFPSLSPPPYKRQYSVNVRAVGDNDYADFSFKIFLPCEAVIIPLYDSPESLKEKVETTVEFDGYQFATKSYYYYRQIEVAIKCNGVFTPFNSVTWNPTPKSIPADEHAIFSMPTRDPVSISADGVDAIGENFSANIIFQPYVAVTEATMQVPINVRKILPPAWVWDVHGWEKSVSTKVNGVTVTLKENTLKIGETEIAFKPLATPKTVLPIWAIERSG